MKTDTSKKILDYILEKQEVSGIELIRLLGLSRQAVQRQLKKLVSNGSVKKIGKPPKVYYLPNRAAQETTQLLGNLIEPALTEMIQNRFLFITPAGDINSGMVGFAAWCEKQNLPVEKTAAEYVRTLKKYDAYKNINGYISGLNKLKSTFEQVYLDELYYLDFYSIERFGKTKLGQMLLYAKQSQNRELMRRLIKDITPSIQAFIGSKTIDAVGFIPPTVKREIQFMSVLTRTLNLSLPTLSLTKISNAVAIPQKSLNKLADRMENAHSTIVFTDKRPFHNILLIDDAVGSGATLNEVAKKIKLSKLCTGQIIGLAITGSYKGFDVISEV